MQECFFVLAPAQLSVCNHHKADIVLPSLLAANWRLEGKAYSRDPEDELVPESGHKEG